ncbi:MAG: carboxypeptidase-like regulatory domain-containing protein, partial [Campylobacterales bacterium]|nr:carboxypeptidase-like regulatory domain-containing protein [Campylobacterales bacterium]
MLNKKVYFSLVLSSVLFITGCSDSSSDSNENPQVSTKSISGNVIDPEVYDASVRLMCGSSVFNASEKTDDDGKFTIEKIPGSINLKDCSLTSSGGVDNGDNLSDLTLKAPMALFEENDPVLITPLTTIVANHKDLDKGLNLVLSEVATFAGLDKEKIKKSPLKDIQLARISKKLTKIAMLKDKTSGKKLGFTIVNTTEQKSFQNFFENQVKKNISAESLKDIQEDITAIDNSTNILDIKNKTIKKNIRNTLNSAYGINCSSESNVSLCEENYKVNIELLTDTITTALKNGEKFAPVNRYKIRKALTDANLSVSKDANNNLDSDLFSHLTGSTSYFKKELEKRTIDIKDIKGITLYNSKNYEKVVGNDNNARLEYYTFSELSHIGEALKIAQSSFDDKVLDPIYQEVAIGYIKLGFYEEAITVVEENIFQDSVQLSAYLEVIENLIKQNQTTIANKALNKAFNDFKEYGAARG